MFKLIKATVGGALLAPIVGNILAVHVLLVPSGLPIAIVVVALEAYLGWAYRDSYRALFVSRAQTT